MKKKLVIPNRLEKAFREFLDIAQFNMPESDAPDLSKEERELLTLVRAHLGGDISRGGK